MQYRILCSPDNEFNLHPVNWSPKWKDYVALSILILFHVCLQWPHWSLDYWIDELYTLEHFVFVPIQTIASDYHVPNNQVLFSLTESLFARLYGIHSLQEALQQPNLMRLWPFVISVVAIWMTYRIAAKLSGPLTGFLAGLLLITSLPFYNYALQLRAYTLCISLYLCLVYVLLFSRRFGGLWTAIFTALLLYALPSNVYILLATTLCLFILKVRRPTKQFGMQPIACSTLKLVGLGAGFFLAFLLYLPMLSQIQGNPLLSRHQTGVITYTLTEVFPIVCWHLLSGRQGLLVLMIALLIWHLRFPEKRKGVLGFAIVLGSLLLLPFLFSGLRGDGAPYRVFLTPIGMFCILAALGMSSLIRQFPNERIRNSIFALLLLYCGGLVFYEIHLCKQKAEKDRLVGQRGADLFEQYYLYDFHPAKDAQYYMDHSANRSIPIYNQSDYYSELYQYLRLRGLNPQPRYKISDFNGIDTVDIITESVSVFERNSSVPERMKWQVQPLLPVNSQIQILRLTKKKE